MGLPELQTADILCQFRGRGAPTMVWLGRKWAAMAAQWAGISALANVVTAGLAIWALIIASGQLQANNRQVQNSLIYSMQKDARETAAGYAAGKATIREVLASMQSVYYQNRLGSIPPDVWVVFKEDMCGFMTRPNIKNNLKPDDTEFLSDDFNGFLNGIRPPCR